MVFVATVSYIVETICLKAHPDVGLGILSFAIGTTATGLQPSSVPAKNSKALDAKMLAKVDKLFKFEETKKALKETQKHLKLAPGYSPSQLDPLTKWIQGASKPKQNLFAFLH